jgi:TatD DNase family protein
MFDTHAHTNFKDFKDDHAEVIRRALNNNIRLINVGSQYSTSQRAVKIANDYDDGVYAAIGLHPIHLSEKIFRDEVSGQEEITFEPRFEEFEKIKYLELGRNKKVVAVGEIGLDYFHNEDNREKQKEVFRQQIDLAMELELPIIIHCRDKNFDLKKSAHQDLIKILREKKERFSGKLRGVVHCFSGGMNEAEIYTTMGFRLGFNGIITFTKDYDRIISSIDLKNILLETDCPYLAPVPMRGKRNEPLFVRYVADKIALLKNMPVDIIEKETDKNARLLFGV